VSKIAPVRTSRTYGPYVRAVYTARTYGPYVRLVRTGAIFDTRIYGLYVRVSKSSPLYTAKGATRGEGGWEDPPPKKKIGRTTPTFYVAVHCSARNWLYHPYFVLCNNLDQGIGPPNFEYVVAPLYTARIYGSYLRVVRSVGE